MSNVLLDTSLDANTVCLGTPAAESAAKKQPPLLHETPVCIVGGGLIGLTTALLLHHQGVKVNVYERQSSLYALPRAATLADEGEHILGQAMGPQVSDYVAKEAQPEKFIWKDRHGQTLSYLDMSGIGQCGHRNTSTFSQVTLESALALRCEVLGIPVYRRWECQASEVQTDDEGRQTYVTTFNRYRASGSEYQTTLVVRSEFVLSAQGGNASLREIYNFTQTDYNFTFDWLIVDLLPVDGEPRRNWEQLCFPARPTTLVSGGPRRLRWEFMMLPGETVQDMVKPNKVWDLLTPYGYHSANSEIERAVVYHFTSVNADRYWDGNGVCLIGDAAHRMPPFIGQGANTGFRDAAGLAWRLSAILTGRAKRSLLESWDNERRAGTAFIIETSIRMGTPICQFDEASADAIHSGMRQRFLERGETSEPRFEPDLPKGGFFDAQRGGGCLALKRGSLMAEARQGVGWELIALQQSHHLQAMAEGRLQAVLLIPEARYLEEYARWFETCLTGARFALVRPDNYAYGFARDEDEVEILLNGVVAELTGGQ